MVALQCDGDSQCSARTGGSVGRQPAYFGSSCTIYGVQKRSLIVCRSEVPPRTSKTAMSQFLGVAWMADVHASR